jgi:hypothetical protein
VQRQRRLRACSGCLHGSMTHLECLHAVLGFQAAAEQLLLCACEGVTWAC